METSTDYSAVLEKIYATREIILTRQVRVIQLCLRMFNEKYHLADEITEAVGDFMESEIELATMSLDVIEMLIRLQLSAK